MRLQLNVTWDEVNRVYLINDGHDNLVISRPLRMHYYQNGIRNRLDFLASEYFCNLIDFTDTDVVIDVGANIGELSIALTKKANIRVIAIEPEEREFRALEHNLKNKIHELHNVPVWSEECEMNFYSCNDTGDSSLIRQDEKITPRYVFCTTLDRVLASSKIVSKIESIKLLKLEAEGAEPEILIGMKDNLARVEYISVDVGAERGLKKESTLIEVFSILTKYNFKPVKFGLPRAVILFCNSKFQNFPVK